MDFPGNPVVKTLPSNAESVDFSPGWGTKIAHASWPKNQDIKQKQFYNKFNNNFKNGPHKKKLKKSMFNIFCANNNVPFYIIYDRNLKKCKRKLP